MMGIKHLWTVCFLLMMSLLLVQSTFDCGFYSSSCETCYSVPCPECDAGTSRCVWCNIQGRGQCVNYFNGNMCDNVLTCPEKQENKYMTLLSLLNRLKATSTNNQVKQPIQEHTSESSASTNELKELLHKLLLLKLLRKVKNEGSDSLNAEDRKILSEYSNGLLAKTTTTTTTTTTPPQYFTDDNNMNAELSKILALLKSETKEKAKEVLSKIINPTSEKSLTRPSPQLIDVNITTDLLPNKVRNPSNVSASHLKNRIESGNVNYEEATDQSILELNKLLQTTAKSKTTINVSRSSLKKTTTTSTTSGKIPTTMLSSYCHVYQQSEFCNSDNNCTWCNTRDKCIARVDQEYKDCAANKKLDDQFGLDECLKFKGCESCVSDPKCYWCGGSKSCHAYPFFGYIPESCASEFFVKQCDVQLAVVIIVLPLIIILLAMVTFYFCLKYCYYRRKVLRVPLFERPGVFDYRKDKKVYFVNPEDEDDSADEMQAEQFRKKYRISADKAPLIDPNS